MWENAFYVGGAAGDDGVMEAGELNARHRDVLGAHAHADRRRLRGRIDLVMAGSGWWSIPWAPPLETRNATRARRSVATFSTYVGAPLVHAAHAGRVACRWPWLGLPHRGHFQGATMITDARGTVLAERVLARGRGHRRRRGRARPRDGERRATRPLLAARPRRDRGVRVVVPASARPPLLRTPRGRVSTLAQIAHLRARARRRARLARHRRARAAGVADAPGHHVTPPRPAVPHRLPDDGG